MDVDAIGAGVNGCELEGDGGGVGVAGEDGFCVAEG